MSKYCDVCGCELIYTEHYEPADGEFIDESYYECLNGCEEEDAK